MSERTITSALLGESCIHIAHPSGLSIYVCEKPDFSRTYALFGTRYGSIDSRFKRASAPEFTDVPEGIAHFLEHKLFESEDVGAFERYAKTGAQANAYTSFDRTCYLFGCSSRAEENLDILLDFVSHPYFTQETVEKEQGIIGQEIRMYDDEPGWRVEFNLLRALYHNHPVRIDIAGTEETISHITADLLYECYNTFYNPSNMFLCVAGNITAEQVLRSVEKNIVKTRPDEVVKGDYNEPEGIVKPYVEQELVVSMPVFGVGFKEAAKDVTRRKKIAMDILLELLAGDTSPFYQRMLEQGLINDQFGAEYFTGHGYEATLFVGESREPETVYRELLSELGRMREEGIDPERFERVRRKRYGRAIMFHYYDVESIASELVECAMNGYEVFGEAEIYRSLTLEDVSALLRGHFQEERSALSVIRPRAGE